MIWTSLTLSTKVSVLHSPLRHYFSASITLKQTVVITKRCTVYKWDIQQPLEDGTWSDPQTVYPVQVACYNLNMLYLMCEIIPWGKSRKSLAWVLKKMTIAKENKGIITGHLWCDCKTCSEDRIRVQSTVTWKPPLGQQQECRHTLGGKKL